MPPGRNWEIPKLLAMGAYPRTICEMGSAGITSSAPGEAAHKYLKLAALHSNRHEDTHLEQVSSKHASCIQSSNLARSFARQLLVRALVCSCSYFNSSAAILLSLSCCVLKHAQQLSGIPVLWQRMRSLKDRSLLLHRLVRRSCDRTLLGNVMHERALSSARRPPGDL